MGLRLRSLLLPLAVLAPAAAAGAQELKSRDFLCAYAYSYSDKMLFVARNIVEVRTPHDFPLTDVAARTQILQRVHGQYSRADVLVGPRPTSWLGGEAIKRHSLGDAKKECLAVIENFRRYEGFTVYGVGSPTYAGNSEDVVKEHYFLSALEFPDYRSGTIAARGGTGDGGKSSGGSSGGSSGSSSSGSGDGFWRRDEGYCDRVGVADKDCMTPAQRAKWEAQRREKGLAYLKEADDLYDDRRYEDARIRYHYVLINSYVSDWHAYARERIQSIEDNRGIHAYADFTRSTGLAFGGTMAQSAFKADEMMFGATVRRRFGAMPLWVTWAGSTRVIYNAMNGEGSRGLGSEFTRYAVSISTEVPGIHLGRIHTHAGYMYQLTDRRELNLFTGGINIRDDKGPAIRLDVTPVYGKMYFGLGMVFDFDF